MPEEKEIKARIVIEIQEDDRLDYYLEGLTHLQAARILLCVVADDLNYIQDDHGHDEEDGE